MQTERIQKAIAQLIDEEYEKPLVDIGLIRDVLIREQSVALTMLMKEEDSDKQAAYRSAITDALNRVDVQDVHVRIKLITKDEKDRIVASRLTPIATPPKPVQKQSPLLNPESGVQFLSIASGKGGVGKSTVTVNLALALHRAGKRVGIIDADIYGFSIPDMLGITEKPMKENNRIVPVERMGVHVISTGFFVDSNSPVIWRGPLLGKMLSTFLNEVEWPALDYILIDLPPGTGDIPLYVHQNIPQCSEIIVTTPHSTASFVAARAGAMAQKTNHHILGVVENMAYFEDDCGKRHYLFGQGGGTQLSEQLQTKLLAQIPISAPDTNVAEAEFIPSVYESDTRNGVIYEELAQQIIHHF
ncbi:Mrp/NBP35 family ATP-binding protein [Paenibacillus marinisediminis]